MSQTATQPGTIAAPVSTILWAIQPPDPAKAPFQIALLASKFYNTWDTVLEFGYNAHISDGSEPVMRLCMEQDYEATPGTHNFEVYWEFLDTGTPRTMFRPIMAVVNRTTLESSLALDSHGALGFVSIAAGGVQALKIQAGSMLVYTPFVWAFAGAKSILSATNNANSATHMLMQYSPTDSIRLGDDNAGRTSAVQLQVDKGTMYWSRGTDGANLGLGGNTFGGGDGVVFVKSAAVAPTSNTAAGGVIYVEAGALKFRGSAGTVTVVAPA